MKKHLAILVIAIMAVSTLSAAAAMIVPATAAPICVPYESPNPEPTYPAQRDSKVNVKLQVSPLKTLTKSNKQQTILDTILYDKRRFDPYMGAMDLKNTRFGHTGTEAASIA